MGDYCQRTKDLYTTIHEAEIKDTRRSGDVNEDHTGGRKREARRDLFLYTIQKTARTKIIRVKKDTQTESNYLLTFSFFPTTTLRLGVVCFGGRNSRRIQRTRLATDTRDCSVVPEAHPQHF